MMMTIVDLGLVLMGVQLRPVDSVIVSLLRHISAIPSRDMDSEQVVEATMSFVIQLAKLGE